MSSHHIIRDNQEAALIIANGEPCSVALLEELLEWSPFIVVLDGALKQVLEWGIKVDVWLGDFDSIESENIDFGGQDIEKVHAPDQDKTDLQKAFDYLITKNFHSVHVLWGTGKRQDHHFNNIFTAAQWSEQMSISFIDDYSRAFICPKAFKKWYPKGTPLSLLPCGEARDVTTKNLVWNLENDVLCLPHKTSSSNEVLMDGFVEISYGAGYLILIEAYEK